MLHCAKNRQGAFTLAEVLITLGIVGVVAAMTIPSLIANYQKNVWEAKIKKTYSIAANACERMLTTEGVSVVDETELYNFNYFSKEAANAKIKEYFKIIKDGQYVSGSPINGFPIYLSDGAVLYLNTYTEGNTKGFGFIVDVNGDSKPNSAGRDQFEFKLDNNCSYYDNGTYASSLEIKFKNVIQNDWKITD